MRTSGGSHLVRQLVRFGTSETLRQIWTTASSFFKPSEVVANAFILRCPNATVVGRGLNRTRCAFSFSWDQWFANDGFEAPTIVFFLLMVELSDWPPALGFQMLRHAHCIWIRLVHSSPMLLRRNQVFSHSKPGTGTGIASLSGSQTRTVVSDIDPRAILIASANFVLNGWQKIDAQLAEGDPYGPKLDR